MQKDKELQIRHKIDWCRRCVADYTRLAISYDKSFPHRPADPIQAAKYRNLAKERGDEADRLEASLKGAPPTPRAQLAPSPVAAPQAAPSPIQFSTPPRREPTPEEGRAAVAQVEAIKVQMIVDRIVGAEVVPTTHTHATRSVFSSATKPATLSGDVADLVARIVACGHTEPFGSPGSPRTPEDTDVTALVASIAAIPVPERQSKGKRRADTDPDVAALINEIIGA